MKRKSKTNIDLDIRFFRRYPVEIPFIIRRQGRRYRAKAVDYSLIGVGIFMEEADHLNTGDELSLDIPELDIRQRGQVAWTANTTAGLRVGILKKGPLKGAFRLYSLPDILIGLHRTLKTGILNVGSGSTAKEVHFRNGNMVYAASNQAGDRLPDVLLQHGTINRKQYDKVAEIKIKTGAADDVILGHMGYLDTAGLKTALELQSKRIIGSLFALQNADFSFIEGPLPAIDSPAQNLSVANLIFWSVKQHADVGLIEKYLLDSIVDFSSAPLDLFQDITLTPVDRAVLERIDGKTCIKDIVKLPDIKYEDQLKIVYALLEARFLSIKIADEPFDAMPAAEIFEKNGDSPDVLIKEIDSMYTRYSGLDYYNILQLERSAGGDDVRRAYYRAAKKYHPDLHLGLPEDTKKKLLEIFTYIINAYLTLNDKAKRDEYDNLLMHGKTEEAPESAASYSPSVLERGIEKKEYDEPFDEDAARFVRNAELAKLRFHDGKTSFWDGDYKEAARLFAMAIYFDGSKPAPHYFYGRALLMIGKYKEAVKALSKADTLDPQNPDTLAELGHGYLKLGFQLRAKGYFEKALQLKPSLARAKEGLKMVD